MAKLFEDLKQALGEAITHANGSGMKLEELKKLCAEAPSPPFKELTVGHSDDGSGFCHYVIDGGTTGALAYGRFSAVARGALPKLIAVAEAAKECRYASLLHDWKPLEDALAALESD